MYHSIFHNSEELIIIRERNYNQINKNKDKRLQYNEARDLTLPCQRSKHQQSEGRSDLEENVFIEADAAKEKDRWHCLSCIPVDKLRILGP